MLIMMGNNVHKVNKRLCIFCLDISKVKTATVSNSPVKPLPLMISHGALIQTVPVVIKCVPHICPGRLPEHKTSVHARTHTHTRIFLSVSKYKPNLHANSRYKSQSSYRHWVLSRPTNCAAYNWQFGLSVKRHELQRTLPRESVSGAVDLLHLIQECPVLSLVITHKCLYQLGCARYIDRIGEVTSNWHYYYYYYYYY
jgi:hypothetical protein